MSNNAAELFEIQLGVRIDEMIAVASLQLNQQETLLYMMIEATELARSQRQAIEPNAATEKEE